MRPYIAPDEIARIIPGEWQQAPVDPYNGDFAYKLFMRGAWPVIIVMFVALWVAK
jgi:hypothetical protein